jgi:tetratricopeptide (TPR) repeat protein
MRSRLAILALSLVPLAACAASDVRAVAAPASSPTRAPARDDGLAAANAHFDAGRWKEAIAAYDAVLASDPTLGQAWFRLGYALHASGDLERACEVHAKAAEFPAFAGVATYNLGCAHALSGREDAAFAALARAQELGFGTPEQLDGDTDLAALRDDPRWAELRARAAAAPAQAGEPALRQLDFWVGDWNVTTADGKALGTNRITRELNGFLILEQWTGAGGGAGKSMNYWDRDEKAWKQVWVAGNGDVLHMSGAFTDGAMRFAGATMHAKGPPTRHRATLTPLADGRVRQTIEDTPDDGATWKVTFDGFYARRDG